MTNKALAKLYQVPLTLKEKKPTTAKGELEELINKLVDAEAPDEVLESVLEIRSLDTTINNYLPNWKPKSDGRVHTTWGFTAPSGQLDASRPNILNLAKWTDNGQRFRRIIEAPTGYSFVEFDYRSFHVATMGYCAEDTSYIRFSQLDPHSIFTSHIMPKDWGKPITMDMQDGEILERCGWIKKKCKEVAKAGGVDIRQNISKRVVLGNQLGLGPVKLHRQNRRFIESKRRAEDLQLMIAELFPKVARFKDWIREKIHAMKYWLIKEWGIIDYFFDVYGYRFNKGAQKWVKQWGTDSEKAIAFPVQGIAFGMLKWGHRRLEAGEHLQRFGFVNSIHDSNVFCCINSLVDVCIDRVSKIMGAHCDRLVNSATPKEGLKVAVEASIGRNLQDFDKDKNPEGMREVKIAA